MVVVCAVVKVYGDDLRAVRACGDAVTNMTITLNSKGTWS
jgi:hypothetical protein